MSVFCSRQGWESYRASISEKLHGVGDFLSATKEYWLHFENGEILRKLFSDHFTKFDRPSIKKTEIKVSSEARDTDSLLSEQQHEDGDYVSSILEIITVSYCCEGFFNLAYQMLFALLLLIVLSCTNWDPALNSLPFYNLQCDHTNWGHPDRKCDKSWNKPTTSRDLNNEIVLILYSGPVQNTLWTSQGYK